MSSSVVTGGISDSDRTNVVLPAPNPPATRTLTGISSRPAPPAGRGGVSTGAKSIQQPFQDRLTGPAVAAVAPRCVHLEVAGIGQVADQFSCNDARNTE